MYVVKSTLKSFIEVDETSHFPIQNLPYGVFYSEDNPTPRVGVAIGTYVLDLSQLEAAGKFSGIKYDDPVFNQSSLNSFMTLGRQVWSEVRRRLVSLLSYDEAELRNDESLRSNSFYPIERVTLLLPVEVSEFTDFYSSYHHAFNVGSMIRGPENAMMPNWKHLPVAYHGRASSVVLSGHDLHRPKGQILPAGETSPVFCPTKRLDYELEMGFFVGSGNELGRPISVDDASRHIFGMVLVNDWSARDVQVWEYRPLGPFLAKNFGTSISPWVVTLDALDPFRTEGPEQDPQPQAYLQHSTDQSYDIELFVHIQTPQQEEPFLLTHSNAKYLYWNISQQLTHHSITGCNMQTGDLCGSGTISGPEFKSRGCLLELTELGRKPIALPSGESRTFLHNGDTISMTGYAQGMGYRVGFGKVTTTVLAAIE